MNLFMASRASGIFSLLEFLLDIVVFSFRFVGRCLPRPVGYRRHSMCGEKTNMLKGVVVIFAVHSAAMNDNDTEGNGFLRHRTPFNLVNTAPALGDIRIF